MENDIPTVGWVILFCCCFPTLFEAALADILISRLSSQGCKFLAVVNYITASASRKREPNDSKFRCPAAVAAPGTSTLFPRDTERHVNRNSSEPSSKVQNVALSTGQKCAILILDDSSGYFVRKTIGLISREKKECVILLLHESRLASSTLK